MQLPSHPPMGAWVAMQSGQCKGPLGEERSLQWTESLWEREAGCSGLREPFLMSDPQWACEKQAVGRMKAGMGSLVL